MASSRCPRNFGSTSTSRRLNNTASRGGTVSELAESVAPDTPTIIGEPPGTSPGREPIKPEVVEEAVKEVDGVNDAAAAVTATAAIKLQRLSASF